ncbi:MAG: family transcriptional regulator, cyclic receptor protein [Actinomycetota bacterium]|jgi:CRP-like cAMP-binding protein|nr:family transcriptional regulator, cyclic receptor protein [Actinomycetota bacterium]
MDDANGTGGFLGRLEPDELKSLEEAGRRRTYRRGTTLLNEGDTSDRVIIVTSGRVKVSYYTEDGREVMLAVRGPGDLLGELSAFDGEPHSATAEAIEEVNTLTLSRDGFAEWLQKNARVALLLLEMLTTRLRDADVKRVEFTAYDTVGRVARRLVELSERFGEETGGGRLISLPLSQEELASWTGCSREAASKALQALRKRGLIETKRRAVTVLDPDGLRRRAT